ncbi:Crp/Fnr family transcriptional regulator [Methylobacterium sp. J-070]|uniref:Crp/Fnr family transcriptional regulator n=1 Tax=Methylobacterium sp. J-070 TaxID=2836650 RepID=UPI001FB9F4DA|nr:Crp/Fnr family transcriptional regulator [Methylobacterium sp. J-070]MCJ2049604.1 Crp/Fnr family transcriptional regulator [Methylobacterium sp. J-070]
MPIDSDARTGNLLLDALSIPDRALITPHLAAVSYDRGATVFEAGDEVTHITFPRAHAVVALVVTTRDGRSAETATIGHEGAVGGIVSQGRVPASANALVQVGGPMLRLEIGRLQDAVARSATLRELLARYADCFLAQLFQTAACNAVHPIEQRCLRWLLTHQDRLTGDTLPITHEVLAAMLGVQRTYLTRILRMLQDQGLVRVARGRITILDRAAVSAAACECHARVQLHCEAVLGAVYGTDDDHDRIVPLAAGAR